MEINKDVGVLMRGIAILMVVIFHFQYDLFGGSFLIERGLGVGTWIKDSVEYIALNPGAWVGFFMALCFVGVNVFFVMSGYGLAKKFYGQNEVRWKDMGKQILKILIPYWIAHPMIHFLDWGLKNLQYEVGLIDYKTYFLGMHSFWQYLESLLVVPRWFSEEGMLSFVGTWWFVGIIVQFYLLFPLLLWGFRKLGRKKGLMACLGISLGYRFLISVFTDSSPIGINDAEIWLFVNFPSRLAEFGVGMYLGAGGRLDRRIRSTFGALILVIIGLLCLTNIYTMFVSDLLFAVGILILTFKLAQNLSKRFWIIFRLIGNKSYLVYLYHEPILKLVLKFVFPGWVN